eukprot:PhF_6_TR34579/c0_g1_i1/m.50363
MANYRVVLMMSLVIVICFVPFVRLALSGDSKSAATNALLDQITAAQKTQNELAVIVEELVKNATSARNVLDSLKAALAQRKASSPASLEEFEKHAKEAIDAFSTSVEDEIKKLNELTKRSYADFRGMVGNGNGKTIGSFIVKWHGDNGIQMSEVYKSEEEALSFYTQVGEFAKKLLVKEVGSPNWTILKDYGGANWLALIKDNDDPQTGQHKPTKPPKKPKQPKKSDDE